MTCNGLAQFGSRARRFAERSLNLGPTEFRAIASPQNSQRLRTSLHARQTASRTQGEA